MKYGAFSMNSVSVNFSSDDLLERAKFDALAEFAAGAGHEINNPLAIISGRAQLLLASEPDEYRRTELSRIIAQANRAHEMIADLRLIGRPPEMRREPVDLRELLDRLAVEMTAWTRRESEYDAAISGIAIRWRRPSIMICPTVIEADPDTLLVALHAVTRNAVEATLRGVAAGLHRTQPPPPIGLDLTSDSQQIRVEITDHGDGIPLRVREHLFDPFYSGRQAGRGLGFGLCKARRIVELCGGTLTVRSTASDDESIHSSQRPRDSVGGRDSTREISPRTTLRMEWPQPSREHG